MAKRSPILGFNHNFRHRGLVFHVQTEDSGVDNPHIFTHLFNGGVILSSRKLTYDGGSAKEVIRALMQAQHKAMLKDLKRGDFDEKIDQYFGDSPDLTTIPTTRDEVASGSMEIPAGAQLDDHSEELDIDIGDIVVVDGSEEPAADEIEMVTERVATVDPAEIGLDDPDDDPDDAGIELPPVSRDNPFEGLEISSMAIDGDPKDTLRGPAPPAAVGETPSGAVVIHAAAPASAPEPPGANPSGPGEYARHGTSKIKPIDSIPAPPPSAPVVASRTARGKGASGKRPRAPTRPLRSIKSNIESDEPPAPKPSVIVGAPPQVIGQPARGQTARRAREQAGSRSLFGKDLISEKSLDEVILAYLSEDGSERE